MARPRPRLIPLTLRAEDTTVLNALEIVAAYQGLPKEAARHVFDVLPVAIRNAPAFKDRLTGAWRYEFGVPYALGQGLASYALCGTDQAPEIAVLFNGIRTLQRLIPNDQVIAFCLRLKERTKHLDYLSEVDPVLRPTAHFRAAYESTNHCRRGKKIDWFLEFDSGISCLLDVKHRIKGLLAHVEELKPSLESGDQNIPVSAPLPDAVFKSSQEKFLPAIPDRWQGVWVITDIYYEDDALNREFAHLDPSLIQFAVFTHLGGDARIFAKEEGVKHWLIETFRLIEMKKRPQEAKFDSGKAETSGDNSCATISQKK